MLSISEKPHQESDEYLIQISGAYGENYKLTIAARVLQGNRLALAMEEFFSISMLTDVECLPLMDEILLLDILDNWYEAQCADSNEINL